MLRPPPGWVGHHSCCDQLKDKTPSRSLCQKQRATFSLPLPEGEGWREGFPGKRLGHPAPSRPGVTET